MLLGVDELGGEIWDVDASTRINIAASGGVPVIQAFSIDYMRWG